MTDEQTHDMSEVIAHFQRLPALETQSMGGNADGQASQSLADLIREWRRMECKELPVGVCAGLSRCDDNTLFNVVGQCFDILLRRIVPRNDLRRRRRKEKRERYRLQREAASAVALAAAFGGGASETASAPG